MRKEQDLKLKKEVAELKQQIEKMRCCGNCKHIYKDCAKEKDCKQNKYKHWEQTE